MAKLTIQQRIINFLKKNTMKLYSNKEISNYLKININTTRKELGNLINMGAVIPFASSNKNFYAAS